MADKGTESFVSESTEKAISSAQASLEGMRTSTVRTAAQMKSIQQAMSVLSKIQKDMSKSPIISDREVKRAKALEDSIAKVGISREALSKASDHEVVAYEELSVLEKMRVKHAAVQQDAAKRMVMFGGKMVELEAKKNYLSLAGSKVWGKTVGTVTNTVRGVANMVTSTAGLEISLLGILALFMKIRDIQNRVGAMSLQTTAQWQGSATALGTAHKAIGALRGEFWKSADAAGEIVVSMARTGVEEKEMLSTARELTAIQEVYGISVNESLGYVGQLYKSYGMTTSEASQFLRIARETTKTIPYLSMQQVTEDMMELTTLTRSYNTDLLGTLSLYNTLMNKDVAKHLGLGDAPEQVRKDIVKTVAGFNTQLGMGWKAALGTGATAAAKILNFETLMPAEQFARMGDFIGKRIRSKTGAEAEFMARSLLEQFGFSAGEVQKTLAKAFTTGGFSAEGLSGVLTEVSAQRALIEKEQKSDAAKRNKLMADASKIAYGMTDFQTKLQNAILNALGGSAGGESIGAILGNIEDWLLHELPPLIADVANTVVSLGETIENWMHLFTPNEELAKKRGEKKADVMGLAYAEMGAKAVDVLAKEFAESLGLGGKGAEAERRGLVETMRMAEKSMPINELNAAMTTLAETAPDLANAFKNMTEEQKKRTVMGIGLAGISSREMYGSTGMSELKVLMQSMHERNVPAFLQLIRTQLLDEANVQKQLKMFHRGGFRRNRVTT